VFLFGGGGAGDGGVRVEDRRGVRVGLNESRSSDGSFGVGEERLGSGLLMRGVLMRRVGRGGIAWTENGSSASVRGRTSWRRT